jgi:demethylspheroidene O-methyltransferase
MALIGRAGDLWRRWRNRLMGKPAFQNFATAFPLTRAISRKRSRELFDLIAGFTYSQTLVACVELGLIERLKEKPATLHELAEAYGFKPNRLERLLKAATALDLLEQTSTGAYDLGIHGAALTGNPWIAGFIRHHHLLYRDLLEPVALLRGDSPKTALGSYWAYTEDRDGQATASDRVAAYTELMGQSQSAVAREILAAYDFSRHRHLLDIGGSNGSFILAAAERHPALRFTLFDLPAVGEIARARLASAGIGSRVSVEGGSFLADPLPGPVDIATLIRVLHDHDDEAVEAILAGARRALSPDGVLVIAEPFSGEPSIAPMTDAYFGLYFAAMGQGKTRNFREIQTLAANVGFSSATALPTRNPLMTGVILLRI